MGGKTNYELKSLVKFNLFQLKNSGVKNQLITKRIIATSVSLIILQK